MRRTTRSAFTLVELLVVMTIIAILVSLTAAAVVKAIQKADETKTRNEISQLAAAIQAFKTDFQVSYVPSRLVLPPALDPTGESQFYISSLWPRMPAALVSTLVNGQAPPQAYSYWGVPQGSNGIVLSGDQTLVFFLGGWRDASNNCFGFSTNPLNPLTGPASSGEARKGPYFDNFPPARLVSFNHGSGVDNFPSFVDVYGTLPYVYFSTRKTANDYPSATTNQGTVIYPTQLLVTGFPNPFTIYPYQISGPKPETASLQVRVWANKSGFQIVAAGRDGLFHDPTITGQYAGGQNWPGFPGSATDLPGYDNMSNFHPTLLGIPAP
jgi:prepilin-type N-terminal cleavage/methylation domain-containing protein